MTSLPRLTVPALVLSSLSLLLAGCSARTAATPLPALRGSVHGGQQPVAGAAVQLYAGNITSTAGPSTPLLLLNVATDSNGNFSIGGDYTCPAQASTPVYLVATGGNPGLSQGTSNAALALMALIGPCNTLLANAATTFVNVDEITTVAAVFTLGNQMSDVAHVGSAGVAGLNVAVAVANQLANTATGTAPGTLPAGSYAPSSKINTLGNILAGCVNSSGAGATGNATPCGQLFTASTYSGAMPANTVAAAIKIAANPTTSVAGIFNLSTPNAPFQPALASAPSDWTVPIAAVTWPAPSAIAYGTALTSAQLDASATVGGSFSYSPAASAILSAGTATLTAVFAPADAADYPRIGASAQLVVTQATPSVAWTTPSAITAGTALSSTQLDATAPISGTFAYTPAAGTLLNDGSRTLQVLFTPADSTDYTTSTKSVLLTVDNAIPSYTFQNVQIVGGGFVTGIVAHPTTANLRYARTDIGGAYRWNQATGNWIPLTDFYSRSTANDNGAESIALDPSDPQRLFLAMGEYSESFGGNGQFLLSDNQGASFTTVNASFKMGSNDNGRGAGERMAVDPNLGTTIYYGSRLNGLWKSTNRGLNWSQVATFPVTAATSGAGVVFVDFIASSGTSGTATPVLYAGVSDTGPTSTTGFYSIYRSVDAGTTWTAVPGQPTGYFPLRGSLGPDGNLYLAFSNAIGPTGITGGAVYQYVLPANSTPSAAGTWNNITPKSPVRQTGSQGGFGAIATDPELPGVLMASTMDDYYPGDDIYRSTNYGTTWVSLNQQGATHNGSISPWIYYGASSTGVGNWVSSLVIDPFNSNHLLYGNGQTVWESTNIETSDTGGKAIFTIGAGGIEEVSVGCLISPPSGYPLLSGVGDVGGFAHSSLTASPSGGMMMNPIFGGTNGLDFAQSLATFMVRTGSNGAGQFGAYSTNGGASWTPFATEAPGTTAGAGDVATAADGSSIVWAPSDAPVAYSTNNGATWSASSGASAELPVFSDRVNPKKYYIYVPTAGTLQISTNGGQTFTTQANGLTTYGTLAVSYAAEGDLWLGTGSGLLHSTNSGVSFSAVSGLNAAYAIGFGQAAPYSNYPTLYVIGSTAASGYGFYRSTDEGSTWILTNNSSQQFGYAPVIVGDPKSFGQFYVGTNGRGIVYGTSPN